MVVVASPTCEYMVLIIVWETPGATSWNPGLRTAAAAAAAAVSYIRSTRYTPSRRRGER